MSGNDSASQWREAHEQWKKINISGQMSSWDEMYGLIVASKENAIGEKQRLVSTVKEFVAGYKVEPSQERVDGMLKFFRKYIGQLLERCEVAEKGFLTFYNTFSLISDPAELFLSAHAELTRQQRTLAELNSALLGLKLDNERLSQLHANAEATLSDLKENGDAPSALKQQLQSLQETVVEMQSEKKALAQMLRASELEGEKLKSELSRLRTANTTLQDALAQSTAKVDEVVSRAERETARLLDEAEESYRQVELLRDELSRIKGSSSAAGSSSALSSELAAMHQLCHQQKAECAHLQQRLDDETTRAAQLTRELHEARATLTSLSNQGNIAPAAHLSTAPSPAQPPDCLSAEARRRIRELERDVLAQRLALADTKEALRVAEGVAESLRRELAVCSSTNAGVGSSVSKDDWASNFLEGPTEAKVNKGEGGLLSENDFMELLADGPAHDVESTNDGEDACPTEGAKNQAALVVALLAQRGVLKRRLAQTEHQLAITRDEFQKLRAKNEQLHADNAMLMRRTHSSDTAAASSDGGFLSGHQVQLLLQEKRSVGGQLQAGDTAAVYVGQSPAGGDTTTRRPRRAVVSQKIFSAVDHVAVIIANMLVFNKYTRAFFVGYLFSLHLVVFAVLYVSSGAYMRRAYPLTAPPVARNPDDWWH